MIAMCYHRRMAQITVRQLDDAKLARLKTRAKEQRTSVEAMARDAIHLIADKLTVAEKQAVVREMQAKFKAAMVPGATQTPGWELIREDRDRDH